MWAAIIDTIDLTADLGKQDGCAMYAHGSHTALCKLRGFYAAVKTVFSQNATNQTM